MCCIKWESLKESIHLFTHVLNPCLPYSRHWPRCYGYSNHLSSSLQATAVMTKLVSRLIHTGVAITENALNEIQTLIRKKAKGVM